MTAIVKQIGLTPKEAGEFSVARLMRAATEPEWGRKYAGFELAASETAGKGASREGYYIPTDVRALTATGGVASGGALVETEVAGQWWAHALTNAAKVATLGAQIVTASNSVAIPRVKPGNAPSAVVENAAPTQNDMTFELVTTAPKTMTNNITASRRLLATTGTLAETIVRTDLVEAIAVLVDQQAVNGSGSSGQTTGLLNTSGLTISSIGTNGGAPAYTNLIDVIRQTNLKKGVVSTRAMGWLTNTKGMSTMRGINKATNWGFLWDDAQEPQYDGWVLGYPASVSDNVPSNLTKGSGTNLSALIFGNWGDLFIIQFSPVGLIVDPYAYSNSGAVRFSVFQDIDTVPRHVDSFCAITDMIAT